MKKIAVINDLSGFGKCSLAVAMPIISVQGIQCCPLTTGVFSNQTGYDSFKSVDFTEYMDGFIDEWKKLKPCFDGILTGFISNSAQGKIISRFIDEFKNENTLLVVDPVMGDDGEVYPCYDDESILAVKSLVKRADIITPNLTELAILCGREYDELINSDNLLDEIEKMSISLGGVSVVTTGVKLDDKTIANTVYSNGSFSVIKAKKMGDSFSGTGDIMSSIIVSKCVGGVDVLTAVEDATKFIETAILDTIGEPYVNADGVNFERFLKTL